MSSSVLTTDELKSVLDLVGRIYDCAIEPERWEATIESIRVLMNGLSASLHGFDFSTNELRFAIFSGIAPEWLAKMGDNMNDLGELWAAAGDIFTRPIDQFHVLRQDVSDEVFRNNRYMREWARPQGICDALQATLARTERQFAAFGITRHDSVGLITPREIEMMALLAPHLRRAVAISDLIDMRTVEANLFSEAWNKVGVALFLIDAEANVVHRNQAAERLLAQASGVSLAHGKLRAADGEASRRLAAAIARCLSADVEPGDPGTGIVLASGGEGTAVAHILPLAPGQRRTRHAGNAVAAVFVQTTTTAALPNLAPVARAYGLTPAETDLLARLVAGDDIKAAGEALGIARTTAKTHLARIFAKTGTNRQSVLVALANKLVTAPIGRG